MRVYHADLRDLPPLAELEACATAERLAASRRMRVEAARYRSLAAGWLLHRAFGKRDYGRNEWGKPFLPGGPHFNLSHSGNRVLLVVADTPCGCDIEERRGNRDFAAIVRHGLHPGAQEDFFRLGATPELFYRFWTLGESYMKGVGRGFSLPPRNFRHSAEPPYVLLESSEGGCADWAFEVHEEIAGYTFSIAWRR